MAFGKMGLMIGQLMVGIGALITTTAVFAAEPIPNKKIQDWTISTSEEMIDANTSNTSGSVFGYICLSKIGKEAICQYYLNSGITCDEGDSIPVLLNSDVGSISTNIRCVIISGEYYTILDYKDVETALDKGLDFGIAVPMTGNRFKALTFSLKGYKTATKTAESAIMILHKKRNTMPAKGRDIYL